MLKKMKKLNTLLLALVMVFAMAVPALANSDESPAEEPVAETGINTLVTMCQIPERGPVAGVPIKVYRIASATVEKGTVTGFTLLAPFDQIEGLAEEIGKLNDSKEYLYLLAENISLPDDVLTKIKLGTQDEMIRYFEQEESDALRALMLAVAKSINDPYDGIDLPAFCEGTTDDEGKVINRNLPDGLYMVASGARIVYTNANKEYTPAPYMVELPLLKDGISNNYVTAYYKFLCEEPEEPEDPDEPPEPTPDPPEPPTPGPEPEPEPDEPVIIPDEPIPLDELPDIEIPDDEIPLDELPQTGLLWWPVPLMAVAGLGCIVIGVLSKRKETNE